MEKSYIIRVDTNQQVWDIIFYPLGWNTLSSHVWILELYSAVNKVILRYFKVWCDNWLWVFSTDQVLTYRRELASTHMYKVAMERFHPFSIICSRSRENRARQRHWTFLRFLRQPNETMLVKLCLSHEIWSSLNMSTRGNLFRYLKVWKTHCRLRAVTAKKYIID